MTLSAFIRLEYQTLLRHFLGVVWLLVDVKRQGETAEDTADCIVQLLVLDLAEDDFDGEHAAKILSPEIVAIACQHRTEVQLLSQVLHHFFSADLLDCVLVFLSAEYFLQSVIFGIYLNYYAVLLSNIFIIFNLSLFFIITFSYFFKLIYDSLF